MTDRATRRAAGTAEERGWWNVTGTEECVVCAARFDYEVEVRCADCDEPVCPLCAVEVRAREARVCVPCSGGPASGEER